MIDSDYDEENYVNMAAQKGRASTSRSASYDIITLIIRKAKNNKEYKKYVEIASMLILSYYRRLGNLDSAYQTVYKIVEGVDSVTTLLTHYKAIQHDERTNSDNSTEQARKKIASTLINDYKKRFSDKKAEPYELLVLQSWLNKVESVNELAILMDSILIIRDKMGNSWDYESHIVPILLDKTFSTEALIDFTNATTNLVIRLATRLKDNYLAVMTAVKILEYADSPKKIKAYLREMIKDASKRMDQINTELAIIDSQPLSRIIRIARTRELRKELAKLTKHVEDMMNGIDVRELMLENTRR